MAYCGQCGASVTDRSCGTCGAPTQVVQDGDAGRVEQQSRNASHWPAAPSPLPAPASPPRPPARRGTLWLVAAAAVAVLVAGFVIVRGQGDPIAASPAPTPPATSPTATQPPTPSPEDSPSTPSWTPSATAASSQRTDPAAALAQRRDFDLPAADLDGRWIAQLASKYDGVVDRSQTAASGGHTFRLADILAEHESLRTRYEQQGLSVLLLQATDFGRQRNWNHTIWVTIVDPGLKSSDAVSRWCRQKHPGLSKKQVTNVCLPRQLQPPY